MERKNELWLSEKFVTRDEAAKIVAELRAKGVQVGFTNGCFDLIHAGHLYSLRQAKSHCDFLVVGVNSDVSVKLLKGESRPIQPQETRADLMASLEFVDLVFTFDEKEVQDTIEIIKPSIMFKGVDYKDKHVPGRDFVEAYGGKCILLEFKDGYSTTSTITKINCGN